MNQCLLGVLIFPYITLSLIAEVKENDLKSLTYQNEAREILKVWESKMFLSKLFDGTEEGTTFLYQWRQRFEI